MLLRPTRIHEKPARFHISVSGYAKNLPDFSPKPPSRNIQGRMQYTPTQVRAKIVRVHISAHGYTKNAPGFTFPNRHTPKTSPVLYPNPWRGTFRGVCNTPLHGYVQKLSSFTPKPSVQDISGRMLLRPYTDTCKIWRVSYFRTRTHQKRTRFHPSQQGYALNAPGFTPKPSARDIWGRMQYAPTRVREKFDGFHISSHGYTENAPRFRPRPSAQDISGRMQYAPTWVREKIVRFYISAHGYTQNPPCFRPKPSAQDISGRMLLRPYTGTYKNRPVSYSRTRIRQKRTRFYPSQ